MILMLSEWNPATPEAKEPLDIRLGDRTLWLLLYNEESDTLEYIRTGVVEDGTVGSFSE